MNDLLKNFAFGLSRLRRSFQYKKVEKRFLRSGAMIGLVRCLPQGVGFCEFTPTLCISRTIRVNSVLISALEPHHIKENVIIHIKLMNSLFCDRSGSWVNRVVPPVR